MPTRNPPRPAAKAAAARPAPLPTFLHPPETETPPAAPEEEVRTTGPVLDNRPASAAPWAPYAGVGSPDPIRTRTDDSSDSLTSSTTKAETARNAGVLLAGVLAIGAGVVAVVLARTGRQLRRPTRAENRAIAQPLARIMVRHVPAEFITADLADLGEAGAAVEAYVSAGPVAPRVTPVQHIGMEHGADPDDPTPTTPAAPTPAQLWTGDDNPDQAPSALYDQGPKPEVRYAQ